MFRICSTGLGVWVQGGSTVPVLPAAVIDLGQWSEKHVPIGMGLEFQLTAAYCSALISGFVRSL